MRGACILPLFFALIFTSTIKADQPDTPASRSANQAGGLVTGRTIYRADAARPWAYSRKYVREDGNGELAGCVVALRSSSLKNMAPRQTPLTEVINQESFQFLPPVVAIRAGDSVRFLNSDATTHNVRSDSRLATFNENASPGFDYTHRFDRPGGAMEPVVVGCVFHPDMRAWVFVFDHPFFAQTKADGAFEFKDVPPGRYRLDVIHPIGQLQRSLTIEVPSGGRWSESVELTPDHVRRR